MWRRLHRSKKRGRSPLYPGHHCVWACPQERRCNLAFPGVAAAAALGRALWGKTCARGRFRPNPTSPRYGHAPGGTVDAVATRVPPGTYPDGPSWGDSRLVFQGGAFGDRALRSGPRCLYIEQWRFPDCLALTSPPELLAIADPPTPKYVPLSAHLRTGWSSSTAIDAESATPPIRTHVRSAPMGAWRRQRPVTFNRPSLLHLCSRFRPRRVAPPAPCHPA